MKNRIEQKFEELKGQDKKAFIAFVTAGDPSLEITEELVLAFEHNGVDIVELGVPFSDPMADGPVIQAASFRALENGVTLEKILRSVERIRKSSQLPIALMTYYNPVFHFGVTSFVKKAKAAGVDGLVIPDLPLEEAGELIIACRTEDLASVFFVAPTTPALRLPIIAKQSSGFIYFVSVAGVTGARRDIPVELFKSVRKLKAMTDKPVCVGFGISTAEQAKAITAVADGVIVGSAIVKKIFELAQDKDLVRKVSQFVKQLS